MNPNRFKPRILSLGQLSPFIMPSITLVRLLLAIMHVLGLYKLRFHNTYVKIVINFIAEINFNDHRLIR